MENTTGDIFYRMKPPPSPSSTTALQHWHNEIVFDSIIVVVYDRWFVFHPTSPNVFQMHFAKGDYVCKCIEAIQPA